MAKRGRGGRGPGADDEDDDAAGDAGATGGAGGPAGEDDDLDDLDDGDERPPRGGRDGEPEELGPPPQVPEEPAPRTSADARLPDAVEVEFTPEMEPPAPVTRRYWLGTTSDSPLQNIVLCGVSFPRYSQEIPLNKDGEVDKAKPVVRGMRVQLTDDQVEAIKAAAVRVRVRRSGSSASLVSSGSDKYRRRPGNDLPVGRYLFMLPIKSTMPVDWDRRTPPPMIRVPVTR